MDTNQETIKIYTGPGVIAQGLISVLQGLNIEPIIKNEQQNELVSGFSVGGASHDLAVFIRKDELEKVRPEIESYLAEVGEK
ncbi:hypothetical protein [Marixanthomonas spongiae]|uniref:DUF2007 domain-containing protein n=1 Tax=Marixanthomonas spongiae TaxID=2174845 RepID=A0A2U0I0P7_9FLAO|nr:hypothetical protein [Marixanthomonas spongiae]PVW14683.1 hypothetical protein DDV96_09190 [Marixanthomonas spongiae]